MNILSKHKDLEQLTEIKANQKGTGLLIEHDGHIIGNKNTIQQNITLSASLFLIRTLE